MAGADELEGAMVAHYLVLEKLSAGGMGVVYRARDVKLGREVALKFLSQGTARSRSAAKRFAREAQAQAAVNHPNVCAVYEFGAHEGAPFLAMELLRGAMLHRHIAKKPLPPDSILKWAPQIARGLEAVHACGIVHRDLKPANVFICGQGSVKILDFGLAKPLESLHRDGSSLRIEVDAAAELTRAGAPTGTPGYASPEQARGEKIDVRSDLFSLGAVLYEMATGHRPFTGENSAEITEAVLRGAFLAPTQLNPAIPRALERIIVKALESDREARYRSAAQICADLLRLRRNLQAAARRKAASARPPSSLSKKRGNRGAPERMRRPGARARMRIAETA
jgi:serine/threonine protein kinase